MGGSGEEGTRTLGGWGCWEDGREGLDGGAGLMRGCHRFFWLALYAQPGLWVGLAIFALVRLESPIWLSLNGKAPFSTLGRR